MMIVFPGRAADGRGGFSHAHIVQRCQYQLCGHPHAEREREIRQRGGAPGRRATRRVGGYLRWHGQRRTRLIRAIGEEGEQWSLDTWSSSGIQRQLLCAIAVAVQRGNAMTLLSCNARAAGARADRAEEWSVSLRSRRGSPRYELA